MIDLTYRAVLAEIERVGGTIDNVRRGRGSHRIIYWSLDGKQFLNTIAGYSGNWRAVRNAVGEVRAKARRRQ